MEGLPRLEYRGYDSAGVALVDGDGVGTREAGRQARQPARWRSTTHPIPPARTGIGHTRWATHGGPTDRNAHPHRGGDDGKLALIHNGIIENFHALKAELLADGFAVRVGDRHRGGGRTLLGARVRRATRRPHRGDAPGRQPASRAPSPCSRCTPDAPGVVVGARRNCPLVVGLGDGENFLGSDVAAFIGHTRHALALGQDQIVDDHPRRRTRSSTSTAPPSRASRSRSTWDAAAAEKGGYVDLHGEGDRRAAARRGRHPAAAAPTTTAASSSTSCGSPRSGCAAIDRSPSSPAAPRPTRAWSRKYAIEHWTRIPVEVELAHEFRYRDPVIDERTLVVSISQSGETMDTLMAVKHARELRRQDHLDLQHPRRDDPARVRRRALHARRARDRGRVDQGVPRPDHGALPPRPLPGPAARRRLVTPTSAHAVMDELQRGPGEDRRRVLDSMDRRPRARPAAWPTPASVLFLGRHVGYPVALEGALKLKELAYIHAEGFAAGELKHGPIALIEPGQPVFVVVPVAGDRARAARARSSPTSRRSAPAAPARSSSPRRATRPCVPFADEVIRVPRRRRCSRRCSPSCRCRSSRWSCRRPRASTSTSRATSPSRSRSSEPVRPSDRRGRDRRRRHRALRATLERTPRLRERLFTDDRARRSALASLAARFAAKEALAKALGAPVGLHWHGRHGGPGRRRAAARCGSPAPSQARADDLGVASFHLSLSHDAGIASAVVVAEGWDVIAAYSVADVRAAEEAAMAELPEGELMARAAQGLAEVAAARLEERRRRCAVVGARRGRQQRRRRAVCRRPTSPSAALRPSRCTRRRRHAGGLAAAPEAGVVAASLPTRRPTVPSDAGCRRGRRRARRHRSGSAAARGCSEEAAAWVDAIPEDAWVIAVDLPSGPDPAGEVASDDAVFADETVTFGVAKPVHLLPATERGRGSADRGRHRRSTSTTCRPSWSG